MTFEKINEQASYGVSAVTTAVGLTVNEWVAIGGLMIGVATFLTNLWYKRKMLEIQHKASGQQE